ncbi:sugar ABC transporter ATP-binding protein, partial [Bacillus sp. SIMBA_161]
DVYENPENVFVGGFIGSPAMNFFTGKLSDGAIAGGKTHIRVPEGKMKVLRSQGYIGKDVSLGIRPQEFHDEPAFIPASEGAKLAANVEVAELMGAGTLLYSSLD